MKLHELEDLANSLGLSNIGKARLLELLDEAEQEVTKGPSGITGPVFQLTQTEVIRKVITKCSFCTKQTIDDEVIVITHRVGEAITRNTTPIKAKVPWCARCRPKILTLEISREKALALLLSTETGQAYIKKEIDRHRKIESQENNPVD